MERGARRHLYVAALQPGRQQVPHFALHHPIEVRVLVEGGRTPLRRPLLRDIRLRACHGESLGVCRSLGARLVVAEGLILLVSGPHAAAVVVLDASFRSTLCALAFAPLCAHAAARTRARKDRLTAARRRCGHVTYDCTFTAHAARPMLLLLLLPRVPVSVADAPSVSILIVCVELLCEGEVGNVCILQGPLPGTEPAPVETLAKRVLGSCDRRQRLCRREVGGVCGAVLRHRTAAVRHDGARKVHVRGRDNGLGRTQQRLCRRRRR